MSASRITELASVVQTNTAKVDEYFREYDLPAPSFDEDGPIDFNINSREIQGARMTAIAASMELQDLLLGPPMNVRPVVS